MDSVLPSSAHLSCTISTARREIASHVGRRVLSSLFASTYHISFHRWNICSGCSQHILSCTRPLLAQRVPRAGIQLLVSGACKSLSSLECSRKSICFWKCEMYLLDLLRSVLFLALWLLRSRWRVSGCLWADEDSVFLSSRFEISRCRHSCRRWLLSGARQVGWNKNELWRTLAELYDKTFCWATNKT